MAPHATLSVAPPHSRVLFFRGSLAADTVILPCFRFRKEILGSAVEGTPKGVQKRYARLSNLLCGLSCHQLCFRLSPAKDVFFAQLLNAHGEVNSPSASTLFVLDRSDIFIYDCHSFDSSVRTEQQSLLVVISVYLRPHDGLRLVSDTNAQRAKNSAPFAHSWFGACYRSEG